VVAAQVVTPHWATGNAAGSVEHIPGGVFHEDALPLQLHKELTPTQVLQYQVQFAASLECIDEVDDERMLVRDSRHTRRQTNS